MDSAKPIEPMPTTPLFCPFLCFLVFLISVHFCFRLYSLHSDSLVFSTKSKSSMDFVAFGVFIHVKVLRISQEKHRRQMFFLTDPPLPGLDSVQVPPHTPWGYSNYLLGKKGCYKHANPLGLRLNPTRGLPITRSRI